VSQIILVQDTETVEAMRLIYERMKIVVEPSSAIVLAAVLANRNLFAGKKVGLILSGGNIDLSQLKIFFG
jgi:threonine dehydratase